MQTASTRTSIMLGLESSIGGFLFRDDQARRARIRHRWSQWRGRQGRFLENGHFIDGYFAEGKTAILDGRWVRCLTVNLLVDVTKC